DFWKSLNWSPTSLAKRRSHRSGAPVSQLGQKHPCVVRIAGRAILANRGAWDVVGVEPVVAVRAQAAELAEPERVVVPSMRRVVVSDGRWSDAACLQAQPA